MDCAKKLLEAKSWPDAQKILETSPSAGPATKQLVEWAFALKETQPSFAEQAMNSAVREMEHDDEHKTTEQKGNDKSHDLPKNGSQEAPTHELNMEPNTQGDAEGSSSHADPIPKEGTKGQVTGLESATGENQMKEMPMPGMAPAGIIPVAPNGLLVSTILVFCIVDGICSCIDLPPMLCVSLSFESSPTIADFNRVIS